ncbi:MAG: hypothetical protein B6D34_00070 [Candidatus Brocadia sp. UTAMX1]|nr:MAG: hypothetical protein B6D34_00070 [Candidatus Brocadia sp. UTAMX1]
MFCLWFLGRLASLDNFVNLYLKMKNNATKYVNKINTFLFIVFDLNFLIKGAMVLCIINQHTYNV